MKLIQLAAATIKTLPKGRHYTIDELSAGSGALRTAFSIASTSLSFQHIVTVTDRNTGDFYIPV